MGGAARRAGARSNVVARLIILAAITGVTFGLLAGVASVGLVPALLVVIPITLVVVWLAAKTINRSDARLSSPGLAAPASAVVAEPSLQRPSALPRPLPDLVGPSTKARERQCPNCGSFAEFVRQDDTTFECPRCGSRFVWRAKTPWPDVVLRPAAAVPLIGD